MGGRYPASPLRLIDLWGRYPAGVRLIYFCMTQGARPVHLIITKTKWIRTSRLSLWGALPGLALLVPLLFRLEEEEVLLV